MKTIITISLTNVTLVSYAGGVVTHSGVKQHDGTISDAYAKIRELITGNVGEVTVLLQG